MNIELDINDSNKPKCKGMYLCIQEIVFSRKPDMPLHAAATCPYSTDEGVRSAIWQASHKIGNGR